MARVPHNKGSYAPREVRDTYQVKIPLGWNDKTKRYDVYNEEVSSEAEAIALIKEVNDFLYHGGKPDEICVFRDKRKIANDKDTVTVSAYIEEYCRLRERQKRVAPRTLTSDRQCLNRIIPYIGSMPLDRVTTADIDRMLLAMRGDGPDNLNGRSYSGTTTLKTYATLNKMFKYAMKKGLVARNPCTDADAPKDDTAEKKSLTLEQVRALHAAIAEEPSAYNTGIAIGLDAGLRLSEMLALTWEDYRQSSLHVTKSLEKEKQSTKKTKNEDCRTVPCTTFLSNILDVWQEEQKRRFAKRDLEWKPSVPIVSSKVGNHITQRNFTRWFENARLKLPIPDDWGYHGLRHTYVTIMNRDARIDGRTVRELSGHRTERAFQTYQHTNSDWQREAARRYEALTTPNTDAQVCACCAHWTRSPEDPAIGACWAEHSESIPVTQADLPCDKNAFKQSAGLEQNLIRMTA